MLSQASFKGIFLAIKIICIFRSGPYVWNQQDQKLVLSKKMSMKIGFYFCTSFVVFHFLFALFRAVQSVLFLNASPAKFLLQLALVGQAGLSVSCQLNTFFQPKPTANFVTSFLESEQQLTKKYQKGHVREYCGIVIWMFYSIWPFQVSAVLFFFLLKPDLPIFFFSVFGIDEKFKYFFIPLEIMGANYAWVNSMYYISTTLTFMFSTNFWLAQICNEEQAKLKKLKFKSLQSLRAPRTAARTYRILQLVTNRYNDFVCKIAMPGHKVANLILTTAGSFGTIRFFGQVNFFAYCAFPGLGCAGLLFANVAYQFGAVLNEKAENFRKSWVGNTTGEERDGCSFQAITLSVQTRDMRRVIRSCRDLKIKVRDFYYFDNTTVSTYISIVVSNTIGLLLAF